MCHTWGLGRLPADLPGGHRGGHHGEAQHVGQQNLFDVMEELKT